MKQALGGEMKKGGENRGEEGVGKGFKRGSRG